jgi:hypothetical protein
MKKRFTLMLFLLGAQACNSRLEDPDSIPPDETLQLTSTVVVLSATGMDTTILVARIPKDAGILDISFSTTAGTFVKSGTKSIKQLADSLNGDYRYASTQMVSDTSPATVYITAETQGARKRINITFK